MREMNLNGKHKPELELVPVKLEDVRVGLRIYDSRYYHEATVVAVSGDKVHLEYEVRDGSDVFVTTSPFDIEYVTRGHVADAKQIAQLRAQDAAPQVKGLCGVVCDTAEENFVERISALMQRNQWSAEFVGEQVGLEKAHLSDVLRGREFPTPSELVEFSNVFGYSIDDLLK